MNENALTSLSLIVQGWDRVCLYTSITRYTGGVYWADLRGMGVFGGGCADFIGSVQSQLIFIYFC